LLDRLPTAVDLPALTSLRFFAAAMIFAFHLREYAPSEAAVAWGPATYHGVSFFFVLSGFVLTHVYAGREVSRRQFYLARIARIVPLHLATLLLLLAVIPLPYAVGQNIGFATAALALVLKIAMLDAWVPIRAVLQSWNNVSWSISAEMAFYVAFPFLLADMTRRPLATLAAAAAVSLAVFAFGAALLPTTDPARDVPTLFHLGSCFPLARGFEFALGMATCLAWTRWVQPARLPVAAWTAIEAAALAGAALWLAVCVPPLVNGTTGALFVWLRACGSCFVFAALILALAGGQGGIGRVLSRRPLVALGEASFAFYMVHMIVMRGLRFHLGSSPGVVSALALSLAAAFLLHHAIEIPMRRRVLARRASAPAATHSRHSRASGNPGAGPRALPLGPRFRGDDS
jgi:peptidoglycan/LPS O-acetylase OafA/YrhL